MTDDELERALFALPLEAPPADLHARILAATIFRPRLDVRLWEVWAIGTALAIAVWLSVFVLTGVPHAGDRILQSITTLIPAVSTAFSSATMVWLALGVSSALWISQLSFPQPGRRTADQ